MNAMYIGIIIVVVLILLFVVYTYTSSSTPSSPSTPSSSSTPSSTIIPVPVTYTYTQGADKPGNDIQLSGGTVQSCQDICTSLPSCSGFNYANDGSQRCYLKNQTASTAATTPIPDWNYYNKN
jgi:PAN domain-containing protein